MNGNPQILGNALHDQHAGRHKNNGCDEKTQSDSPHLQRFIQTSGGTPKSPVALGKH
jgi:hypothetical protein